MRAFSVSEVLDVTTRQQDGASITHDSIEASMCMFRKAAQGRSGVT